MRSQAQSSKSTRWILLAVAVLAPALIAYQKPWPLSRIMAQPTPPPLSLYDTFTQLRDWSDKHAYVPMRAYLDPACREHVLDLLVAIDELLVANAAAQEAIKRACPGIDPSRFDISAVADDLGLFSRRATFIHDRQDDGYGIVTVELDEQGPVELVFERHQERWVYVPDWASAQLVVLVREAAAAVERFTLVVSSRSQTAEEISSEFAIRVVPRLTKLTEQIPHGGVGR